MPIKRKKVNQEVRELKEIDKGVDKLNFWMVVNTIATVVTGVTGVIIAILAFLKQQ